MLDPLLTKSIFKESGMLSINIGDSTVEVCECTVQRTQGPPPYHHLQCTSNECTLQLLLILFRGSDFPISPRPIQPVAVG